MDLIKEAMKQEQLAETKKRLDSKFIKEDMDELSDNEGVLKAQDDETGDTIYIKWYWDEAGHYEVDGLSYKPEGPFLPTDDTVDNWYNWALSEVEEADPHNSGSESNVREGFSLKYKPTIQLDEKWKPRRFSKSAIQKMIQEVDDYVEDHPEVAQNIEDFVTAIQRTMDVHDALSYLDIENTDHHYDQLAHALEVIAGEDYKDQMDEYGDYQYQSRKDARAEAGW